MAHGSSAGLAADASREHLKGFAITGLGVAILSSDAILIRLIDAGVWTVVFWRGLLMAIGFLVLLGWFARGRSGGVWRRIGPGDIGAGLLFGVNTVFFVSAVSYTTVANALLIIGAVPLATAFIAWLALGERVARRTWLAIAGALFGLSLIFADRLAAGHLRGELFALAVVFCLGGYFTLLRASRSANPLPALVLAGLVSSAAATGCADTLALAPASIPYAAVLGLLVMPASFTLISLGPRYLPAAEVSLVMLLEAVLAGLWAWLVLNETPTVNVLIGGAVVLASVGLRAAAERFGGRPV